MKAFLPVILLIILASCYDKNSRQPDLNISYTKADIEFDTLSFKESVYVPIYSEIYHFSEHKKILLTAVLSVRNTDMENRIFINNVDYYNSKGDLKRKYIDETIELGPLESTEFIVDYKEKEGGTGANFVLGWGVDCHVAHPVIHAVMIGTSSQQGLSFTCDAVVIKRDTLEKEYESQ